MRAPAEDASGLGPAIASAIGAARLAIVRMEPLAGGAVRRHWRVVVEAEGGAWPGRHEWVLRADGQTPLDMGLDLRDEFTLLRFLHRRDVPVPPPVLYCGDRTAIGASFHLTQFLPGSADPDALAAAAPNEALAERLGAALARLHQIRPPVAELAFLGAPPADPARALLAAYRWRLDAMGEARPAAEWGMRLLERHAPPPLPAVLCHGDFRTGNYLVADRALVAVLDWEFAAWGDPDADLGWFCSRCWRFGVDGREAGGIGSRAAFHRGYESVAGRVLDPARLRYWEAMAALKWLVIALLQRNRFLVGGERSLDLALTGRRAAECEFELLRLTEAG